MNYMQESEWDTAMLHGFRLHEIRMKINQALLEGNYKKLHNLSIVFKNELVMVMSDDQRTEFASLLNDASTTYSNGGNASAAYDKLIQYLTLIQNNGGLGIKRKVDMRGATGKR